MTGKSSVGTNSQKFAKSSEEFCDFEDIFSAKFFLAQNYFAVQGVLTEHWQDK